MIIAKQTIVGALRSRGQDIRAEWVDKQLPDEVQVAQHSGLLSMLGLEVADLVAMETEPSGA